MERIVFGTSGWRGILCEEFTFPNVRKVIRAIADHVIAGGDRHKGLVVGYDSRFMGQRFAQETARVLAGSGIKVYLCDQDTPLLQHNVPVRLIKNYSDVGRYFTKRVNIALSRIG
jgi:phosphoglucomutase